MTNNIALRHDASDAQRFNLSQITSREQGRIFRVNKQGKLVEIKGFYHRLYYFFFRDKVQKRVKAAVSLSLTAIDSQSTQVPAIKSLFFERLSRLSEQVFDRSCIPTQIIKQLRPVKSNGNGSTLAKRVEEVRFAVSLGVDFQRVSEGQCGTYYGRDYKGSRLVVFKPYDEESSSMNSQKVSSRIKSVMFTIFPFLRTHKNIKRDCAYLNEIGASRADRYLGLGMIPETELVTFESEQFSGSDPKKGSCQLYVENTVMMQKKVGLPSFDVPILKRLLQKLWMILFGERVAPPCTLTDLKKWAIIDFLTGNQDGHLNNQLWGQRGVTLIDYGLSFPSRPSDGFISSVNQYHFAHLQGAEENFKMEDRGLIHKLRHPASFISELTEAMTDGTTGGFDQAQIDALNERIQILCAVIDQGKSIRYLGNIKYAEDFERAKQELNIPSNS